MRSLEDIDVELIEVEHVMNYAMNRYRKIKSERSKIVQILGYQNSEPPIHAYVPPILKDKDVRKKGKECLGCYHKINKQGRRVHYVSLDCPIHKKK